MAPHRARNCLPDGRCRGRVWREPDTRVSAPQSERRRPALIDADTSVWESNTILRYIATRFGPTHFYHSDPAARAACECWMDWPLGTMNLSMPPLQNRKHGG